MNDRDNTCDKVQELLEAYAMELLGEEETRRCEEHLSSCGACRELLAEVRDTVRLLESLPGKSRPGKALPQEEGQESDLEGRILSLAAAEAHPPVRRWAWIGRAAAAAGWLIAVGLGASAVTAAYLRNGAREDGIEKLSALLEAQESRIAFLEGSRLADRAGDRALVQSAVTDAVAAELPGRIAGLQTEIGSLRTEIGSSRAEVGRLAGEISRLEPLREEVLTLSKDLAERSARGTRLESALGELAARLEATGTAIELQDRALGDLAARVEASEGPPDGLAQAPQDSVAVPLDARARGAATSRGQTLGQTRVQTPWDAAFRMASGVVQGGGRDLRGRIRDYQDDLFRIYTVKN